MREIKCKREKRERYKQRNRDGCNIINFIAANYYVVLWVLGVTTPILLAGSALLLVVGNWITR